MTEPNAAPETDAPREPGDRPMIPVDARDSHVRALAPAGAAAAIRHAPWYSVVTAAVVDVVIGGGLVVCLYGGRFKSTAAEIIAIVVVAAIAGVRVADLAAAVRSGNAPTGAGPALVLFALLSQTLSPLGAAARTLLTALGLLALLAGAQGCAGGATGAATTAAALANVSTAVERTAEALKVARRVLCTSALDPLLGDPREGQPRYVREGGGEAHPPPPPPPPAPAPEPAPGGGP